MNKVYFAKDGIFPETDTKVRVFDPAYSGFSKGDEVFVASYTWDDQNDRARREEGIVVSSEKGRHGNWITAWELVDADLSDLTDKQKQEITDKALDAAKKRGYCEETQNILRDLGLPTQRSLKTETITIEVEVTHAAHGNGNVYPGYITMDYGNGHVEKMVPVKVTLADGTELVD